MAQYNYATKNIDEHSVKAVFRDAEISTKTSIELGRYLSKKPTSKAKRILEESIAMKVPIPYKTYTNGLGHKKGSTITSGRFSVKACGIVLKLIKAAEANAQDKGLNANALIVYRMVPQRAAATWHYGRQSRRKAKKTHLEIVLKEQQEVKKITPEKKTKTKPVAE